MSELLVGGITPIKNDILYFWENLKTFTTMILRL